MLSLGTPCDLARRMTAASAEFTSGSAFPPSEMEDDEHHARIPRVWYVRRMASRMS